MLPAAALLFRAPQLPLPLALHGRTTHGVTDEGPTDL